MGLTTAAASLGAKKPIKDAFAFCFTLNNPTYQEWYNINSLLTNFHEYGILYYGYGIENFDQFVAPKDNGGQLHLQGVLVSSKKLQLAKLKKISRRAHWETMSTSLPVCILYCSKEGKFVSMGDYRTSVIRLAHRRDYPDYKLYDTKQYDPGEVDSFIEMCMFGQNTGPIGMDMCPSYEESLHICVHHRYLFQQVI